MLPFFVHFPPLCLSVLTLISFTCALFTSFECLAPCVPFLPTTNHVTLCAVSRLQQCFLAILELLSFCVLSFGFLPVGFVYFCWIILTLTLS